VTPDNPMTVSVSGTIEFSAGGNVVKTCNSFTTDCVHSFNSGTSVTVAVVPSSTEAFYFYWNYNAPNNSVGPCPDSSTAGGSIYRNSPSLTSFTGTLSCPVTMTSAKNLQFNIS
jgi:hypothetical protein